jgi:Icc-related predicted phosphoesterase
MRILAFTDLHESKKGLEKLKEKAKDADLLVCAGDISIFAHSLNRMLAEINAFNKPTLIIHGNHESEEEMREHTVKHDNIIYLHKEIMETQGFMFVCYGGGGFSHTDRSFEMFADQFKNKFKGKNLILVTHAPPYSTKLDRIGTSSAGNKSIRKFIESYSPVLSISGHLHENSGKDDKIGNTLLVNPGPFGKLIRI